MTTDDPTNRVHVIGMGMSPRDLTADQRAIIDRAQVLVGGRRQLAAFPDTRARCISIDADLAGLAARIREAMAALRVVVLASGDPLFYGIGGYLLRVLGREHVRVWPNVNAVAAAFARIGRPWQDAEVLSLHGRQAENRLVDLLRTTAWLAVFTDPRRTPSWVASRVAAHGGEGARLCILERMGYEDERVRWLAPAEAENETFAEPNLVVIETGHAPPAAQPFLGLADEDLAHERGLITKSEVRAVALAKLQIRPGMVVWDLGAGSGAVSIEAACLAAGGRVCAVEKNPDRAAQIRSNCRRLGAGNVQVVAARLPDGLDDLPAPDRVFVGGGGKSLADIVARAARRLQPGGIMVVNAVLLASMQTALATLRELGFTTDVTQIQISRSRAMTAGDRMEALNPVWIVRGGDRKLK